MIIGTPEASEASDRPLHVSSAPVADPPPLDRRQGVGATTCHSNRRSGGRRAPQRERLAGSRCRRPPITDPPLFARTCGCEGVGHLLWAFVAASIVVPSHRWIERLGDDLDHAFLEQNDVMGQRLETSGIVARVNAFRDSGARARSSLPLQWTTHLPSSRRGATHAGWIALQRSWRWQRPKHG